MASSKASLIGLGAGAASMTAIIGLVVLLYPLFQSDPPPFVGKEKFDKVAQNVDLTRQLLDKTANSLQRLTDRQDQGDLDYWNGQIAIAEARLKVNPNDELARNMIKIANDQISMINTRLAAAKR